MVTEARVAVVAVATADGSDEKIGQPDGAVPANGLRSRSEPRTGVKISFYTPPFSHGAWLKPGL